MEIALILIVVAALVAFFLLRGKKKEETARFEKLADQPVTQAEKRQPRRASPTTQAESPQARRLSEAPSDVAAGSSAAESSAAESSAAESSNAAVSADAAEQAASAREDERYPGSDRPAAGVDSRDAPARGSEGPAPGEAGERVTASSEAPAASVEAGESGEASEGFVSVAPETEAGESPPPLVRGAAPAGANRKVGLLSLRRGLKRSRDSEGFFGRLKALLGGKKELAPDIADEIEEILLTSDVGVRTTDKILERIKEGMTRGDLSDEAKVFKALREEAHKTLAVEGTAGALVLSQRPTVVLFVGVNGAGKTTTIGKLAQKLTAEGKKVMLSAGDTFRAAAVEQLRAWGERSGCDVITGKEGADPSSVLFDAITAAKAAGVDVLLADTAGRLHTKTNLMQEMTKIQKVAGKALDGAPHETLLVIDSTNGQNALAQAREFKEALPLTGLVLTKLDGTAKGGVVLGICDDLKVPVRYVGVGERAEDLLAFEPAAFVEALLGAENEVIAA